MPRRIAGVALRRSRRSVARDRRRRPAESAKPAVTISGRAYAFNHMRHRPAPGATIRVRELPGLSAITDATGDYALEVPDDTNVTPYIEPPPGYQPDRPADLPHARRADRERQLPDPGGRRVQRARGAALGAVRARRPPRAVRDRDHGLGAQRPRGRLRRPSAPARRTGCAGATARAKPGAARADLLQRQRDPGPLAAATSGDGGIIWTEVPAGTYRVITESPSTRSPASSPPASRAGSSTRTRPGARTSSAGQRSRSAPGGRGLGREGQGGPSRRRAPARRVAVDAAEPLKVDVHAAPGRRAGRAAPQGDASTWAPTKLRVPVARSRAARAVRV